MSIFKNFLKYKKGFSGEFDTHPLEKPLMHDKVYEYHHKKAVWKTEDCTIQKRQKGFLRTNQAWNISRLE